MAFAAARMILKDKRRKSKDDFAPPSRTRSKVLLFIVLPFVEVVVFSKGWLVQAVPVVSLFWDDTH